MTDWKHSIARQMGITAALRKYAPIQTASRAKFIQPLELIAGMTAAPQPCFLLETWDERIHPARAYGEEKIDGIRAMFIQTRILSREALPLDCALHCLPALVALEAMYGEPMVFDGEYRADAGFQATLAEHKAGEGCGTFWIFDAVPYREWAQNRFTERLDVRRPRLIEFAGAMDHTFVKPVAWRQLLDAEDARQMAAGIWQAGGEGIVVKRAASLYARGRSKDWLKLKQAHTLDAVISDLIVDNGRVKAILARLPEGKVVKIGAAIPETLRLAMASAPGDWSGCTIEIGFSDKTDSGALRGGYFVRVRPDKGAV